MPKCMGGHALGQFGPMRRLMERLLNHRFARVAPMPDHPCACGKNTSIAPDRSTLNRGVFADIPHLAGLPASRRTAHAHSPPEIAVEYISELLKRCTRLQIQKTIDAAVFKGTEKLASAGGAGAGARP